MHSRRDAISAILTTGAAIGVGAPASARAVSAPCSPTPVPPVWSRGLENQRKADLGNGTFLNPVMAGSYPDPTILKDGRDYYMTFSSFEADPGLLIWHSQDLVNWTPLVSALPAPLGSVFAVDLVKHDGRYYIYIPFVPTGRSAGLKKTSIYVIHSTRMDGGWSKPVDLGIHDLIDPGHAVGEDGERYLFLSGGHRVRLSRDGLSANGPVEKVYDGWKYPDDWITEAYALEGPKIRRRGEYFYLVSAVGGTGGPPTGHMVIVARSKSINGPWDDCPRNPIVRTKSAKEAWWSRGHASLVEGPAGDWWMVYHGYENGFRTLGRQMLLEPIRWSADGWPEALGGDLARPLPKPAGGRPGPHGIARSDDFRTAALTNRWSFHAPGPDDGKRVSTGNGNLTLQGSGTGPNNSSPLTNIAGDRSYDVSVKIEVIDAAIGGLLLYLSDRLFLGLSIDGDKLTTYAGGQAHYWREPVPATRTIYLRIENREHIVTFYYSLDGKTWTRHGLRMEASGYNANTILPGQGEGLQPALFSAGQGRVRFSDYRYRAL